jgi:hypothetical protein
MHGFRNAIEGPIFQIPGSAVRLDAQSDVLWRGFNVRFGGSKRGGSASTSSSDAVMIPPPTKWVTPSMNPPASSLPPLAETDPQPATAPSIEQ